MKVQIEIDINMNQINDEVARIAKEQIIPTLLHENNMAWVKEKLCDQISREIISSITYCNDYQGQLNHSPLQKEILAAIVNGLKDDETKAIIIRSLIKQ